MKIASLRILILLRTSDNNEALEPQNIDFTQDILNTCTHIVRVRVGTAYDIPACVSQPGVAPRRGVVRRGGGTFFIIDAVETSPCGIYIRSYDKCFQIC